MQYASVDPADAGQTVTCMAPATGMDSNIKYDYFYSHQLESQQPIPKLQMNVWGQGQGVD